jgi:hypothetical protein
MTHPVDGFNLKFTARTNWKAELRERGVLIDTVPVTWTKGWAKRDGETFLRVWFRKQVDLQKYNARTEPFLVAVAKAKDYAVHPHQFDHFTSVFRVAATGEILDEISIQTRVVERVRAS